MLQWAQDRILREVGRPAGTPGRLGEASLPGVRRILSCALLQSSARFLGCQRRSSLQVLLADELGSGSRRQSARGLAQSKTFGVSEAVSRKALSQRPVPLGFGVSPNHFWEQAAKASRRRGVAIFAFKHFSAGRDFGETPKSTGQRPVPPKTRALVHGSTVPAPLERRVSNRARRQACTGSTWTAVP